MTRPPALQFLMLRNYGQPSTPGTPDVPTGPGTTMYYPLEYFTQHVYVDPKRGADGNDGTTREKAVKTLYQGAVLAAERAGAGNVAIVLRGTNPSDSGTLHTGPYVTNTYTEAQVGPDAAPHCKASPLINVHGTALKRHGIVSDPTDPWPAVLDGSRIPWQNVKTLQNGRWVTSTNDTVPALLYLESDRWVLQGFQVVNSAGPGVRSEGDFVDWMGVTATRNHSYGLQAFGDFNFSYRCHSRNNVDRRNSPGDVGVGFYSDGLKHVYLMCLANHNSALNYRFRVNSGSRLIWCDSYRAGYHEDPSVEGPLGSAVGRGFAARGADGASGRNKLAFCISTMALRENFDLFLDTEPQVYLSASAFSGQSGTGDGFLTNKGYLSNVLAFKSGGVAHKGGAATNRVLWDLDTDDFRTLAFPPFNAGELNDYLMPSVGSPQLAYANEGVSIGAPASSLFKGAIGRMPEHHTQLSSLDLLRK